VIRPLLAAALAAVAVSVPAAAGIPSPGLTATVGPSSSITFKKTDGTTVRNLDPGMYLIEVSDQSVAHNFHLVGAAVDRQTEVETTTTTQWTVEFKNGTYKFMCDAHPLSMRGTFTVGPVTPGVPKLVGKITPRAISLKTAAGVRVRTLRENTYKLVVSDTSKAQNFHLSGPGVNRKTRVAATTRASWTVKLLPGKYVYRSDRSRKLRGTFTVTPVPPPLGR
jgi:hypothetical protein